MLKLCVALLICVASVSAMKCRTTNPRCLHIYFDDQPKLTQTCMNECDEENLLAVTNYTSFDTFSGRCFFKDCRPNSTIHNTGTPLCVMFLKAEPMNFDSESELNKYLCQHEELEVASIPGSSKC